MIKNISVIDMQGNVYEATYPKRARGLVKKGRARFVNESTICLAGPPYQTEDNQMDINAEGNEIKSGNAQSQEAKTGGMQSQEAKVGDAQSKGAETGDTQSWEARTGSAQFQGTQDGGKIQCLMEIFQNIRMIVQDTSYIQVALERLENVSDCDALERIGNIVDAREATNQKAIETLGELANKLV